MVFIAAKLFKVASEYSERSKKQYGIGSDDLRNCVKAFKRH